MNIHLYGACFVQSDNHTMDSSTTLFGDPNQLAQQLGISVLLFFSLIAVCLVILHYIRKTHEMYQRIIDGITASSERHYKLLEDTLRDNRDQINILRGLVEKTKTMQQQSDQAFRDLFQKVSTILETRCHTYMNKNRPNDE